MTSGRDAGAMRSSSRTGLRPLGALTRTTVGGEVVVNMPRSQVSVVAAVILRRKMINAAALVVRNASRAVAADTGSVRPSQQHVQLGGAR